MNRRIVIVVSAVILFTFLLIYALVPKANQDAVETALVISVIGLVVGIFFWDSED